MTDATAGRPADRAALLRQARFSLYAGPVTNISRRVALGASPQEIYRCLLDSRRHSELTGQPARLGSQAGDPVSLAGGQLTGLLMEVLEDRHVVFALRGAGWPAGHYSTTTFMLRPEGKGTTLVLFVQAVPQEQAAAMSALWQETYLDTLTVTFASGSVR